MEKGVAVNYLILMVVGLLILVIAAYLIFRTSPAKKLSIEECRTRLIGICTTCKTRGWPDWPARNDPRWADVNKKFYYVIDECSAMYDEFKEFKNRENCTNLKIPCRSIGVY